MPLSFAIVFDVVAGSRGFGLLDHSLGDVGIFWFCRRRRHAVQADLPDGMLFVRIDSSNSGLPRYAGLRRYSIIRTFILGAHIGPIYSRKGQIRHNRLWGLILHPSAT